MQALGEQRANGAVREPGGEGALLPGAAFAAEEAAGDAARGIEPFFVVHGQGQEVYIFGPGAVRHDRGGQHDGLAIADGDCAVGLESQPASFENQGFAADFTVDDGGGCKLSCHNKKRYLTQR